VNLNAQSRAEYLRHVELIDLQLDFFKKSMKQDGGKGKRKNSDQSNITSTSQEDDSSSSDQMLQPPQSLHEIFQISNKNRKLNK